MLDEKNLQERIEELRGEFGGLLDDDVLRKLALDEMGMLNRKTISEFKDRDEVTLDVIISSISEAREFKRKNGEMGRVRNLIVEDASGSCRLTLWEKDTALPEEEGWKEGDRLRLINCYVRFSDFGIDISKGKIGQIEILREL